MDTTINAVKAKLDHAYDQAKAMIMRDPEYRPIAVIEFRRICDYLSNSLILEEFIEAQNHTKLLQFIYENELILANQLRQLDIKTIGDSHDAKISASLVSDF